MNPADSEPANSKTPPKPAWSWVGFHWLVFSLFTMIVLTFFIAVEDSTFQGLLESLSKGELITILELIAILLGCIFTSYFYAFLLYSPYALIKKLFSRAKFDKDEQLQEKEKRLQEELQNDFLIILLNLISIIWIGITYKRKLRLIKALP